MATNSVLVATYRYLRKRGFLLGSTISNLLYVSISKTPLGYDAWGRAKAVFDYSILHGIWTFDVPNEIWKTAHNGVEYADNTLNTHVYSEDGQLVVSSGATTNDYCVISSKRHPRYQPNRGHLYSTSVIIPDINTGTKEFGIFTEESGVFFRQKEDGKLYAVLRSLEVETKEEEININGIDLTRGNTYDIQFQWRGVGSYFFYINNKLVHSFELLGTLTALSMANPALPIRMRAINTNGQSLFKQGCVDVTSEGGESEKQQFLPIVSTEGTLTNEVILATRVSATYNGKYNTRDSQLHLIKANVSKKCDIEVYITRDTTAITGGTWVDANGGGIEKLDPVATGSVTFDTAKAKLVDVIPCVADIQNIADNPDPERIEFFLTNGDYLILKLVGSAVTARVIIDIGEEI